MILQFFLLAILWLSRLSWAQENDCAYPTTSDAASVVQNALLSGDAFSLPVVNIVAIRPLCLAYSRRQHRYRGVSILVRYTCTGSAACPRGEAVEQFESACQRGTWSYRIFGTTAHTRTARPRADFSTLLREDCAYCFSPELASSIGASGTPDPDNHCIGMFSFLLS